jgi:UDP-glucose 4-epimerase
MSSIKTRKDLLSFRIGDVRDYAALTSALRDADVVFHAAALKQVPSCEYFPFEAVQTNIGGAANLVRAIRENDLNVEKVIGISTDKACKPINVMGMTKASSGASLDRGRIAIVLERVSCAFGTGNVIASRGSIVPLFVEQGSEGRLDDSDAAGDDADSC